jgi:hypothetical protein
MSLLEQLAKQAEQKKTDLGGAQVLDKEASLASIEASLVRLKDYLLQLTTLLAQHPEKVQQNYEIPGYGTVVCWVAHDYIVKHNQLSKSAAEVTLSFNANIASELCPVIDVQGVSKIQTIKALFDKHRINAITDAKKDSAGATNQANFRARGKIPLTLHAVADQNSAQLRLSVSNFEDLGTTVKLYTHDQIDDLLFDVIGHYVARKDNELTKEKLPDGVLKKLRHTAQQAEMRRRWEEKMAQQALEAEEKQRLEEEQNKLHNRMLAQGKHLFGKLSGLIKKKDGDA